ARGVHRAVRAERDDGVGRARVRPLAEIRRAHDVDAAAALDRPLGDEAGRRVGLLFEDQEPHFTRKAPRMNGWMRQKYVYVPAPRSVGVCHVLRLDAAVKPAGPKPSSPESKLVGPLASGKAMPVVAVHGARQAVMVWKMLREASSLTKVSGWPGLTTGGRPAEPAPVRSPWR